jgi:hypothetical protein
MRSAPNDSEGIRRRMEEMRAARGNQPTTLYDASRLSGCDHDGTRCPKCGLAARCLGDTIDHVDFAVRVVLDHVPGLAEFSPRWFPS